MRVRINGVDEEVGVRSIAELIATRRGDPRAVVVAINFRCIARSRWEQTAIDDGDVIEILSPMQGG